MLPTKILAQQGKDSFTKVTSYTQNCERMNGVYTVRASGSACLPLFIFYGQPGGPVEEYKFPSYPGSGFYTIQKRDGWTSRLGCSIWIMFLPLLLQGLVYETTDFKMSLIHH